MEGMMGVLAVYEPPASRFACRVPLLLTQKGEGGLPAPGIPRSLHFVCSRPFRFSKGAFCCERLVRVWARVTDPPLPRRGGFGGCACWGPGDDGLATGFCAFYG